jgi:pyruvate/oxaloacetate carboxyltransferase
MTEEAVSFAVSQGLPVMYVTEDTTRATPETIRALYTTAIAAGAKAVCVCDTVGHSTPDGARAVVSFVKSIIEEQGGNIRLDWHGHQDRGLGVINSLAAIDGGADQVHGSALGIGERVGNAPLDQLLVNLKLLGWISNDLSQRAFAAGQCLTIIRSLAATLFAPRPAFMPRQSSRVIEKAITVSPISSTRVFPPVNSDSNKSSRLVR